MPEKVVRAKNLLTKSHTENHFLGQFGEYERTTSLATVGAQIVGLVQTRVFWISTGAMFFGISTHFVRMKPPCYLQRSPKISNREIVPDLGRFREIASRHLVTKRTLCTHKTVPIPTWTTQDHPESRFWRLRATQGSPPYTTVDYYLKKSTGPGVSKDFETRTFHPQ